MDEPGLNFFLTERAKHFGLGLDFTGLGLNSKRAILD